MAAGPATIGSSDVLHPAGEYSRGAKWFHWLTLPPLALLLFSGMTIRFINDGAKMSFYTLHESLGLSVLVLTLLRLAWRLRHVPPGAAYLSPLVRVGSGAVHAALYVALIVQPTLGFFTTNAYGFPQQGATAFLGFIDLPRFMDASPALALRLHWAHSITGWLLVPLVITHVAGVLYHHIVKRDGTLMRMV